MRIPSHAAVSTSVDLATPRERGFVNASAGDSARMSNQAEDTPIETDESEAADSPAEHDERAHDESSGTSTSDLPQGAKDGELPPAP